MSSVKYLLVMLFSIALAACGGGGGGGGGSNVTAPSAPTTVTASPGNTSATVSFTAPANNGGAAITGYTVTSSPDNITKTGTASPITVTGLTNGTAYTFTVVATNSAGNSAASTPSNSVTPSATAIAPDAPTSVTATAGSTTATVTFTAPASNGGATITGYTVTSIPAGGTDSNAATTGLTHTITGLTNGTAYTFTVVATNSVPLSSPASSASNSVTPTVAPTVPGAPTIGTATAGNASATVTFTAPASTGGAAITGYTVTSSPAGGTDSNAATTGLTHTITGLSNGTAYTFTVKATNSVGSSPASSASNSVTPVTVPGAPTAVTGTVGNAQVTVSFTAPTNTGGVAITGYTVTSSPGAITATGTASPITVTGLTNNTAYTFTVVATNSAGSSAASTPSTAVTPITGYTVPGVPTNVAATAGNTSATVTFTAPTNNGGTAITGYTVTSSTGNKTATGTGSPLSVTGLTNGVAYTFTVVATNSVGNSAASSASNSVTPALAPVSGTVTGAWPTGVTINVTGTNSTQTTTDSSGNYSVNLAPGSYTLTASLPGYTFSALPGNITVPAGSSTAITGNNFVSSSAVTSYSVSGTLTNSSAAAGGGTIRVFNSGCTNYNNCQIVGAAHFASLAVGGTANYTIRGLQPGNYDVKAGIGVVSSGWPNASNPTSGLTAFTIASANVNSVNMSMADVTAPTPTAPTSLSVSPGNTAAFIQYKPFTNANGAETATSYKIYWGTDAAATNGVGSPVTFAAQGLNQNMYFMKGLTSGTMYFRMTALVGTTESAATGIVAANIGGSPPVGTFSVSGTVTCTACPALSASTPMIVGLYDQTNGIPYFTTIASPSSSQAYTITGVPSGTNYYPFAVIDMNNNGRIDVGDISNTNGNGTSIAVSGTLANNTIALTYASATVDVYTGFWSNNGTSGSYNANLSFGDGTKRLVGATLFSGPNVPVPSDLSTYGNNWTNLQITGTPSVGDSYQFLLTFSDGSSQNMTASVTGVLGVSNLAKNLVIQTTTPGSPTVPLFTWAAPTTMPASYTYRVNLNGTNNSTNWNYPKDAGLPYTTLSALYNVDGSASGPLVSGLGNTYNWQVEVRDANHNSATMQAPTYTLP